MRPMTEHEATAKGKTILSESNHDTATGVDVGVGSCEDGGEENGVDDVREDLDTSAGSHNDERRGRSILSTAVEGGVVEGHVDTDKEDGSHEQAENTPECPADSFRDGLAGVGSLTSSDTNELGSLERETSGDENSPEADKLASGAFNAHVGVCDAGVVPVLEANVALVTDTSVDADGEDDEANDGDDLDHGKPHLNLTKDTHRDKVESRKQSPEDADPNGDAKLRVPVLNDDTRSDKL
ncbi:hypothetical protein HG531_011220 [Fusarium graminearum]|nr:hypothetical protein HG531_011220 [Fusarium graminearum]